MVVAIKKSDLYSSLWKSCDELRGGMDASQYKDYILTMLFVKYVTDKHKSDPNSLIDVPASGSFDDMVALKGDKEIGDKINKIFDVDDSITYQLTSSGTNSTLKLFSFTGGTFSLSPTVKGLVSLNVTKSLGSVAVVPEPETYALLALGLVGLGVARQRKKAREINAFPALTA